MDKEYFLNAGIPPSLHFEPSQWQPLTSVPELNSWEKSTDQFTHFESALSSMVSSPAASNSAISGDNFVIRELIGKLGSICNPGDMSPSMMAATSYIGGGGGGGNNSTNTSCYSTPLNSPPKLHMPIMENFVSENLPNLGSSMPLSPALLAVSADPGFAERAAKFSCFGSRSFNGRTNQVNSIPADFQYRSSNSMVASAKLPRVCSSPSLKAVGSQLGVQEMKNSAHTHVEMKPSDMKFSGCGANSNEESSVSEQITLGESVNPRKRKAVSKGKAKETASKEAEADHDDCSAKKSKQTEGSGNENGSVKAVDEAKEQEGNNTSSKPPEPPKDYIHVRARRGQATDSHSLAERVRREKISERMKLLQDLVPGCNKVTGKALMLDEIINYVQSLQRQVEFLSMKLATINPRLDFNMDSLLSKDMVQASGSLTHPTYPSVSAFYGHQPQQNPQVHNNISNGARKQCPGDPLDATICRNLGLQLPLVDGFGEGLHHLPAFSEDDLQSIVQMGFGDNPNRETTFHSQNFHGLNQSPHTKIEP